MDATARPRESEVWELAGRTRATRAVARHRCDRGISIGSSGSQVCDATVRDASSHGCRVDSQADWLRMGAFVSIRPDDESVVMGIVRWVRGGSAGIEFLQPLDPAGGAWHALLDDLD